MSAAARPFQRRDRDQLTALVNLHVGAVIPGITLSVNTVLGQLEREPQETIVDPWVAERCCLVVERPDGITAGALLHRYRDEADVGDSYRSTGEIRWMVCRPDVITDGEVLLDAALEQMRRWHVRSVGADCTLPAPGCFGIPETMPHLRRLLVGAGFGEPTRAELVLVAPARALVAPIPDDLKTTRVVGPLGTRWTLRRGGAALGSIEFCDQSAELARSSSARRWADIGNLSISDDADPAEVMPALLSCAARWMRLGGTDRLIAYWAADVDPKEHLALLRRAGFELLTRTERGFSRSI